MGLQSAHVTRVSGSARRAILGVAIAGLLSGLVGCRDRLQDPEVPALDLSGDTVRISAIGDTAGQFPEGADVEVVGERRWLHDRPVLDPSALDRRLLVARAPGTAGLRVVLPDGEEQNIIADVRPNRPTVTGLRVDSSPRPGDVARLRGYRLAELADGGLRVNERSPEVLGADSANLRFRIPGRSGADSCAGAAVGVISAVGGRVVGDLSYRLERTGDIGLEVGEARLLERGTHCLRLEPRDSARYALAYLDVDAMENARDGPEGFDRQIEPPPDLFSVSIADGVGRREDGAIGEVSAAVTTSRTRGVTADVRRVQPGAQSECGNRDFRDPCAGYRSRTVPWTVGDTFRTDLPDGRSGRARVVQVHEDYLAVALFEPDSSAFGSDRRDAFRAAAATALDVTVPTLRSGLTESWPVTSDGSGQLLVLLSRFTTDSTRSGREAALTFFNTDDQGRFPWIALNLSAPWSGESAFLDILAHELTHAWARQYLWESPSTGGTRDWGLPPLWAEEGVADFFAFETLRRVANIGATANFSSWHDLSLTGAPGRYSAEARYAVGTLTRGYQHASSFLRDQVVDQVRRGGRTWEAAVRSVVRGALEGWHGYDEYGARRTGLTRRMRRALGGEWRPPRAALRWSVSQALDDRTESPRFQNAAFDAVSGDYGCGCGWRPHATIDAGSGDVLKLGRRYGSTGYFFLNDRGLGGSYRLGWSETEEPVRWMVARYR